MASRLRVQFSCQLSEQVTYFLKLLKGRVIVMSFPLLPDCEVSQWSPWDAGQCKCGNPQSNMTRTRVKTTEASPTGRPCPAVMSETRPCPSRPCYELRRSSNTCDLQGASCGVGVARFNVTCVREGTLGPPEHLGKCQNYETEVLARPKKEDVCFKSCPTDCVLSEWSPWSDCHGQCLSTPSSKPTTIFDHFLVSHLYM